MYSEEFISSNECLTHGNIIILQLCWRKIEGTLTMSPLAPLCPCVNVKTVSAGGKIIESIWTDSFTWFPWKNFLKISIACSTPPSNNSHDTNRDFITIMTIIFLSLIMLIITVNYISGHWRSTQLLSYLIFWQELGETHRLAIQSNWTLE